MSEVGISLINRSERDLDHDAILRWAELVCAGEELPAGGEIDILICGDEEIQRLNRQYRGVDKITDVLSFGSLSKTESQAGSVFPPESCDIVIDINQLDRQKGNNTLQKELMDILIHGLLHVAGYDHIRAADVKLMKEKETHYRQLLAGETSRG